MDNFAHIIFRQNATFQINLYSIWHIRDFIGGLRFAD